VNFSDMDANRQPIGIVIEEVMAARTVDAPVTEFYVISVVNVFLDGLACGVDVVEKGGGSPDKTPVEQSEAIAEASFAAVREEFPDADDHTAYARDVVGAIFDAAKEVDASAITYRSRGGNRIVQFLSGDLSLKLVTKADRPVIALPRVETETSE